MRIAGVFLRSPSPFFFSSMLLRTLTNCQSSPVRPKETTQRMYQLVKMTDSYTDGLEMHLDLPLNPCVLELELSEGA